MPEFFKEEKKAIFFKRVSDAKNIEALNEVFIEIGKSAAQGNYDVKVQRNITEVEKDVLEELGFYITWFDEDDDEYKEGFRTLIDWEDVEEDKD